MIKQLKQIEEFNKAFNISYKKIPSSNFTHEEVKLRYNLMKEELEEWFTESYDNIQNRAKELADLLYVVYGTILNEGLQNVIEEVFDKVHQSNMSKLDNNGKPVYNEVGKVIKSENYKKPDLTFIK